MGLVLEDMAVLRAWKKISCIDGFRHDIATVPHLYLLLRGFEPQTFSLLPPELSCHFHYKENIRIFLRAN